MGLDGAQQENAEFDAGLATVGATNVAAAGSTVAVARFAVTIDGVRRFFKNRLVCSFAYMHECECLWVPACTHVGIVVSSMLRLLILTWVARAGTYWWYAYTIMDA